MSDMLSHIPANALKPHYTGARVTRKEDARLMTGTSRYLDDIDLPGMYEIAFVRSQRSSARIRAIHLDEAKAAPGVKRILTASECPCYFGSEEDVANGVEQPALAREVVRYVGEPIVAIIAESRYAAEDAAERVIIDYEPLQPVLAMRESLLDQPRRVHEKTTNRMFHSEYETAGFEEAFQTAPYHLVEVFQTHRQTGVPLETRGLAAALDPGSGRLTLYATHQSPHGFRSDMAVALGIEENELRVIVPEVGGAFGIKAHAYPEYLVVAYTALTYKLPVKWISDRTECLLTDVHARDDIHEVEVAFAEDGRILALRDHLRADAGAYSAFPFCGAIGETVLAARVLTGPYTIPHLATTIDCTYSNKTPLGAYRGVWGPIASFVQEGIIDRVARARNLDPAEVRRVNLISDEHFPYTNAAGQVYDRGSYRASLEKALEMLDYENLRAQQRELRAQGKYIGIGISAFVEPTAMAQSEAGSVPYESATLRIEPNGSVTAAFGLGPSGQGHETTMAQLIADELGVDFKDIVVLHGDTDSAPFGGGTGGSRSGPIGGGAALKAGRAMREKLQTLASHLLEAAKDDIQLEGGKAFVAGVPSRNYSIRELAQVAYTDVGRLPEDFPVGLEVIARYQPKRSVTFSNGTHIAVVEVDIETGIVKVLDYVVVNDCGRLINPLIVEGQIQGGVAQGLGSAYLEELRYDDQGQVTTTTLADYLLPVSTEVPRMRIAHIETLSSGEGGIKGMGEGSLIASPAAFANAVSDALEPFGFVVSSLPVTPDQILAAIDHAMDATGLSSRQGE